MNDEQKAIPIITQESYDLAIRKKDKEISMLRSHLYSALVALFDDTGKVIHEEMPMINAEIETAKGEVV